MSPSAISSAEAEFLPDAPNRVWAADIKQIKTGEGWLYLAAVQERFSRRIVGWAMAGHMRAELVVDALEMAVRRRRPAKGTIHHSDHGGQFVALAFGQACHDAGIAQSMGAVGSCFDNAVAETFFATLTKELLLHRAPKTWATRAELRSAIFEYVEGFYNPTRLHSTLGMRSPVELEADQAGGDPDGLARAGTSATRAKNLCTTFGCAQLRRQHQPDSTKSGEVQLGLPEPSWCLAPSGRRQQPRSDRAALEPT